MAFLFPRPSISVLALIFVGLGSFLLDQSSKQLAHTELLVWQDENNIDLYQGKLSQLFSWGERRSGDDYFAFNLHYSRNKGAAFSMLSDMPDAYRDPFFYLITIIATVMIAFYLKGTLPHQQFSRYGLVMILSGAWGNCTDRFFRGYVVDFLDAEWQILGWRHDFAIFNVADVAINIGVACLLVDMLREWRLERQKKKASEKTIEAV
jgi:signal peptidase II